MTLKQRIYIRIVIFLAVAVAIYYANRYFAQKRIDGAVEYALTAQSSIVQLYGLSTEYSASSTDTVEAQIPTKPSDPNNRRALGDSFESFVRGSWNLAIRMRDKYKDLSVTEDSPNPDDVYPVKPIQIDSEDGKKIQLDFSKPGEVSKYSEKSENGSLFISYHENGNPGRITYYLQPKQPLKIILGFHKNGMLFFYVTYYQGGHLGPAIAWGEFGQIENERFRSRPHYVDHEYWLFND